MKSIEVKTVPTADINCVRVSIQLQDYDLYNGPTFSCLLYNPNGNVIDRVPVQMALDDYQNWPASETPEEDEATAKTVVLTTLGLEEDLTVEEPPADPPA